MQVEQIDREAAEEWKWVMYDREAYDPLKEMENNVAELAEDFARHRIAEREQVVKEIVAWLRQCGNLDDQDCAEMIEAKWGKP